MSENRQSSSPVTKLIEQHRDAILALAARHDAVNVCLFGSVARGDETTDSDIDFVVEFPPPYYIWQWIRLQNDLQALLQHRVDVSVRLSVLSSKWRTLPIFSAIKRLALTWESNA